MTYKQCQKIEKIAKRAADVVKDKSLWQIAYSTILDHIWRHCDETDNGEM